MRDSQQEDSTSSPRSVGFGVDRRTGEFTTLATLTDQLASPVSTVESTGTG